MEAFSQNKVEDFSQASLHEASIINSPSEVKRLLSLGADVNARDKNNQTPLHVAAFENWMESHYIVMKILLTNKADVNSQDGRGKTPLHYLVENTGVKIIELLLKFGAKVNVQDYDLCLPVTYAIRYDPSIDVVKVLLDASARDINSIVDTKLKYSLLHSACLFGRRKILKFLVKYGANTESINRRGRTPLLFALTVSKTDIWIIVYLLKCSNVNALDRRGKNILNVAEEPLQLDEARKMVLLYLAKYQALNLFISPSIVSTISNVKEFNDFFKKCTEELTFAKSTKLENCWVTFFNLLFDCKRKLKNYAGNQDLIQSFNEIDLQNKLPLYGDLIKKNITKAVKTRKIFDESSIVLSDCLPIFNPNHLIIRDVMDCLTFRDYVSFVGAECTEHP